MRSDVDYEVMARGVNLPIASVVKTTPDQGLNRWRSWLIVGRTNATTKLKVRFAGYRSIFERVVCVPPTQARGSLVDKIQSPVSDR